MRSRLLLFTLGIYLIFTSGCTSKPSPDNSSTTQDTNSSADNSPAQNEASNPPDTQASNPPNNESSTNERPISEAKARRHPVVVRAGKTVTVSLGSALGSKLSQTGDTFNGTIAQDVTTDNVVAIRHGATISGTVTDAKPLGRFAGGAVLQLRIDSIHVKGRDIPVQAALRTFTAKGKGKRTAVMTGGGAALGGIIGGLAGGGKGAAIGLVAGGGAGGAGAALTGNKDIVLPAESAVSFELAQPLELR